MSNLIQDQIFYEIQQERKRQDEKWGVQTHAPADWLTILGEEVGEVNKAAYEAKFCNGPIIHYRDELIQVAAVAVSMLECYYRISDVISEKESILMWDEEAGKISLEQCQDALKKLMSKNYILNPNLLNDGVGE